MRFGTFLMHAAQEQRVTALDSNGSRTYSGDISCQAPGLSSWDMLFTAPKAAS
jgi:hypothetical protein